MVWARRLGGRGEDRRVGVGGRGKKARVGMLLRVVGMPLLCGWCATRRGGIKGLFGVADRKIVDGWRCDWGAFKQARKDPLACERPKLPPRHSLEAINQFDLDSSLILLRLFMQAS